MIRLFPTTLELMLCNDQLWRGAQTCVSLAVIFHSPGRKAKKEKRNTRTDDAETRRWTSTDSGA
ncbi:unnamed protein product [Heterobilharzia americana]|nr:unnamed protein product [Heterobilharzia americana]